ncbi:hypothetical protein PS1_031871 [Malus domestica]
MTCFPDSCFTLIIKLAVNKFFIKSRTEKVADSSRGFDDDQDIDDSEPAPISKTRWMARSLRSLDTCSSGTRVQCWVRWTGPLKAMRWD